MADYSPLTVFQFVPVIRQSITTSGAEYAATLWQPQITSDAMSLDARGDG
jgi:hypothetical protein